MHFWSNLRIECVKNVLICFLNKSTTHSSIPNVKNDVIAYYDLNKKNSTQDDIFSLNVFIIE